MVDYAKDSCFPKEYLVSILFENKTVSDAGDSQTRQLPDHRNSGCRTVQVRAAGTSFDRSAFPQAFAHMERHKRKEFSSSVMCQSAAPRAWQVPQAVLADCSGWWDVSHCAVHHITLCPYSTPRRIEGQAKNFSFQVMKAEQHGQS